MIYVRVFKPEVNGPIGGADHSGLNADLDQSNENVLMDWPVDQSESCSLRLALN